MDCAQTLMRRQGPELLEEVSEAAVYRLGRAIAAASRTWSRRCSRPASPQATFHTDDVHLLANTLYATGLGGMQLARVGMLVKEAAPGVPTVAALSPDRVSEHLVATSIAMAVGAPA